MILGMPARKRRHFLFVWAAAGAAGNSPPWIFHPALMRPSSGVASSARGGERGGGERPRTGRPPRARPRSGPHAALTAAGRPVRQVPCKPASLRRDAVKQPLARSPGPCATGVSWRPRRLRSSCTTGQAKRWGRYRLAAPTEAQARRSRYRRHPARMITSGRMEGACRPSRALQIDPEPTPIEPAYRPAPRRRPARRAAGPWPVRRGWLASADRPGSRPRPPGCASRSS